MQLKCAACGAALRGRDIDVEALRARCSKCGWELLPPDSPGRSAYRARVHPAEEARPSAGSGHDEASDGPAGPGGAPRDAITKVALPPLPSFVTVTEVTHPAAGLEIVVRNNRWWRTVFIQVVICIYLGFALFVGVHIVAAVAGFALASWLFGALFSNERHLRVGAHAITVHFKPFPYPSKRVDSSALEQLWVDEVEEYRGDQSFRLRARLRSGRDINLVRQLSDPLAALHLERRIEEHLGLIDKPIHGELSR